MLRIFISHSTNPNEAAAVRYLNDLADGLGKVQLAGQPAFDVFLDRRSLKGGDAWRQKIINRVADCDAAVFLLTPRALNSDFVRFEVSNLLLRHLRLRDPATATSAFPLIPLMPWFDQEPTRDAVEAAVTALLESGFWQGIGLLEVNYEKPKTAAEAVVLLEQRLAGLARAEDGPLEPLAKEIAKYLSKVERSSLDDAAVRANVTLPAGADDRAAVAHVARGLLLCSPVETFEALAALNADLDETRRSELFELLAPSWVSPEAALELSKHLVRDPPGFCPIVNGTLVDFTPEMYVRRARGQVRKLAGKFFQVHEPTNVNDLAELRYRVAARFVADNPQAADYFTRVRAAIEKQTSFKRPVVVAIPITSEADLDTLIQLSKEDTFRRLVFFALTGESPVRKAAWPAVELNPPLQPAQELAFKDLHDELAETFG